MYGYVGNNSLRFTDPYGLIQLNPDGSIKFNSSGHTFNAKFGEGETGLAQPGFIYADDGTPISVLDNKSGDSRFDTNCHGVSFTDGGFYIDNLEANKIILGDGYTPIPGNPKVGNIAIYTDPNGRIVHSAPVTSVSGNDVFVTGLSGTESHTTTLPAGPGPGTAWEQPGSSVHYFQKWI